MERTRLPPRLQHELRRGDSVWHSRLVNLYIPAVFTIAAWLALVWNFGGFN